jgi:hypothetical protein
MRVLTLTTKANKVRKHEVQVFSNHTEKVAHMSDELDKLLDMARRVQMTPEQAEEQRRSFAYGNTKIENDSITRDTVDRAADTLNRK